MKKLLKILPVVLVVCLVFTSVFAGNTIAEQTIPSGTPSTALKGIVGNVWATVMVIVRVLAVAAIVFAGVRYMFASADQKADIKKSMGILAIGGLLVFGATFIVDILTDVSSETLDNGTKTEQKSE